MATEFDFSELGQKLDRLAQSFEYDGQPRDPETGRFMSPEDFDPAAHIGNGVRRAMEGETGNGGIVRRAQSRAKRGDANLPSHHANTIQYKQDSWDRHHFYATSNLVAYHEFGTGKHGRGGSYQIPLPGNEPVAIPAHRWDGPDEFVYSDGDGQNAAIFNYVEHPGVEGKHFMQRALNAGIPDIKRDVSHELDKMNVDIK